MLIILIENPSLFHHNLTSSTHGVKNVAWCRNRGRQRMQKQRRPTSFLHQIGIGIILNNCASVVHPFLCVVVKNIDMQKLTKRKEAEICKASCVCKVSELLLERNFAKNSSIRCAADLPPCYSPSLEHCRTQYTYYVFIVQRSSSSSTMSVFQ